MVSRSQLPADRRAAIKLHEERGEAAESRRLLYVALTRAKEALVVSMRGKSSKVDATGLSKSCWGDVQSALVGECCAFEPGVSMFDFGGQRPAHVECMHLTPADVEELLGGAAGVAGDAADGVELQVDGGSGIGEAAPGGCPAGGKPGMIALPVVRPYEPERGKPYDGTYRCGGVRNPGSLFLLGQTGYHRHLCGYHHRGHDRAHTEYNLYLQDGKTDRPG